MGSSEDPSLINNVDDIGLVYLVLSEFYLLQNVHPTSYILLVPGFLLAGTEATV